MIKGKVEAKITFDIEVTDNVAGVLGVKLETMESMISEGWLVDTLNELFSQAPLFRLLGSCKVEQISAEVREDG